MSLNFFEDGSPFLNHPLLTSDRTAHEIDFLTAEFKAVPGSRWLDLGCGFGRHANELAARGFDVVGLDASAAMIAAARQRAADSQVAPEFQVGLAENYVASTPFDAVISLFTSLGQLSEAGENSRLLNRAAEALKPGGWLAVELPQREAAVALLKPSDQFGSTAVRRRYDPATRIVTETFAVGEPGDQRVFTLRYRLYSRAEIVKKITAAGLIVRKSVGDYHGIPLTADDPTMVLLCQKERSL